MEFFLKSVACYYLNDFVITVIMFLPLKHSSFISIHDVKEHFISSTSLFNVSKLNFAPKKRLNVS